MFSQLLDVLAQAMEYLLRFFYNWTGNYGISIILLTLFIRLILSPLIHKQNLSTRKMQEDMQELQPEIKKLQEKYGNNSQKLNEEMMKLYKEKGINPLGGCLPGCSLLIQLPILMVLYRVLMAYDYGQAGFLWLPASLKRPLLYPSSFNGSNYFLAAKNIHASRRRRSTTTERGHDGGYAHIFGFYQLNSLRSAFVLVCV